MRNQQSVPCSASIKDNGILWGSHTLADTTVICPRLLSVFGLQELAERKWMSEQWVCILRAPGAETSEPCGLHTGKGPLMRNRCWLGPVGNRRGGGMSLYPAHDFLLLKEEQSKYFGLHNQLLDTVKGGGHEKATDHSGELRSGRSEWRTRSWRSLSCLYRVFHFQKSKHSKDDRLS